MEALDDNEITIRSTRIVAADADQDEEEIENTSEEGTTEEGNSEDGINEENDTPTSENGSVKQRHDSDEDTEHNTNEAASETNLDDTIVSTNSTEGDLDTQSGPDDDQEFFFNPDPVNWETGYSAEELATIYQYDAWVMRARRRPTWGEFYSVFPGRE